MRSKIVLLKGEFASSSLHLMLKKHFSDAATPPKSMTLEDVMAHLHEIAVLVLPGITHEKSPYPLMLTGDHVARIRAALEDGMTLHTDCAASYYMARDITYKRSDGVILQRDGLGLIPFSAVGPVDGTSPENAQDYSFYKTRMIDVVTSQHEQASIAYGNGPAFFDDGTDDAIISLAHYKRSRLLIAGLVKEIGEGRVISMGVLPQISYHHLRGKLTVPAHEEHRTALYHSLYQHDAARQALEDKIIGFYKRSLPHATP